MINSTWIIQTGWDDDQDFIVKILSESISSHEYKVINDCFIRVHSAPDSLGVFIKTKIKDTPYDAIAPIHIFRLSQVI